MFFSNRKNLGEREKTHGGVFLETTFWEKKALRRLQKFHLIHPQAFMAYLPNGVALIGLNR
jgi:hypothetical protein